MGERADLASLMRPTEAARALAISRRTLSDWALAGLLPFRETPGGHRRYPRDVVLALAARLDHSGDGASCEPLTGTVPAVSRRKDP